jgi:hypothetical protein
LPGSFCCYARKAAMVHVAMQDEQDGKHVDGLEPVTGEQ